MLGPGLFLARSEAMERWPRQVGGNFEKTLTHFGSRVLDQIGTPLLPPPSAGVIGILRDRGSETVLPLSGLPRERFRTFFRNRRR